MSKKTATQTMMEEAEKLRKKYLDSFDERLSEIEHQLNVRGMGGATDPHKCFICGKPADMGWGNAFGPQQGYCREHVPETATRAVGEYTCKHCNQTVSGKHVCIRPDLPLRVRVAKAIGWYDFTKLTGGWRGFTPEGRGTYPIEDYPNDLVAAMGALEEYAEKNCSIYIIRRNRTKDYQIVLYPPTTRDNARWYYEMDLSQAICEAIITHTEGK